MVFDWDHRHPESDPSQTMTDILAVPRHRRDRHPSNNL